MSDFALQFDAAGKKFSKSRKASLSRGLRGAACRLLGLKPDPKFGKDEFWALRGISFRAVPGECIGIIGPNGAGKSTLLKLAGRDYLPDAGRVLARGRIKSLLRLGTGLQPMLTGRENIYLKCAEIGFSKLETDRKMDAIVALAGLERSLDRPVRHYSDGMYARLEFAIATAAPWEILLIDEVLSVGDVAFQVRALARLEQLKQKGTAILLVSHAEMPMRRIADRCLLLADGEVLASGAADPVFRRYYESVGFIDPQLKPLDGIVEVPEECDGPLMILSLAVAASEPHRPIRTGLPLVLTVRYSALLPVADATLVLHFWTSSGVLLGSLESEIDGALIASAWNGRNLRVRCPFFGLPAGIYRIAGGFRSGGRWLAYRTDLLRLAVAEELPEHARGLFALPAEIHLEA